MAFDKLAGSFSPFPRLLGGDLLKTIQLSYHESAIEIEREKEKRENETGRELPQII